MKRLVLIDGHAILHRAYHAFPKTLKTRRGELVNAVYGFTRMLLKVVEDLEPDYLAVAFDVTEKPTFRHREFIGYQAQRPAIEAEMADQLERVRQVIRTLNIPIFEIEGYEADDTMGTLANQAAKKKVETIIVTGDKDIFQLIKARVRVYAPKKGFSQAVMFDRKKVKMELGVYPKQIVDYKALVGDPSDNYPGVHGIGPKTAVKLLEKYKDLDTIYKNIEKIEERVGKMLAEGAESAALSKKLAQIITKMPIKLDLRACRVHDYDEEKAKRLFEELEFKSLIKKLPGVEEQKEEEKQIKLL